MSDSMEVDGPAVNRIVTRAAQRAKNIFRKKSKKPVNDDDEKIEQLSNKRQRTQKDLGDGKSLVDLTLPNFKPVQLVPSSDILKDNEAAGGGALSEAIPIFRPNRRGGNGVPLNNPNPISDQIMEEKRDIVQLDSSVQPSVSSQLVPQNLGTNAPVQLVPQSLNSPAVPPEVKSEENPISTEAFSSESTNSRDISVQTDAQLQYIHKTSEEVIRKLKDSDAAREVQKDQITKLSETNKRQAKTLSSTSKDLANKNKELTDQKEKHDDLTAAWTIQKAQLDKDTAELAQLKAKVGTTAKNHALELKKVTAAKDLLKQKLTAKNHQLDIATKDNTPAVKKKRASKIAALDKEIAGLKNKLTATETKLASLNTVAAQNKVLLGESKTHKSDLDKKDKAHKSAQTKLDNQIKTLEGKVTKQQSDIAALKVTIDNNKKKATETRQRETRLNASLQTNIEKVKELELDKTGLIEKLERLKDDAAKDFEERSPDRNKISAALMVDLTKILNKGGDPNGDIRWGMMQQHVRGIGLNPQEHHDVNRWTGQILDHKINGHGFAETAKDRLADLFNTHSADRAMNLLRLLSAETEKSGKLTDLLEKSMDENKALVDTGLSNETQLRAAHQQQLDALKVAHTRIMIDQFGAVGLDGENILRRMEDLAQDGDGAHERGVLMGHLVAEMRAQIARPNPNPNPRSLADELQDADVEMKVDDEEAPDPPPQEVPLQDIIQAPPANPVANQGSQASQPPPIPVANQGGQPSQASPVAAPADLPLSNPAEPIPSTEINHDNSAPIAENVRLRNTNLSRPSSRVRNEEISTNPLQDIERLEKVPPLLASELQNDRGEFLPPDQQTAIQAAHREKVDAFNQQVLHLTNQAQAHAKAERLLRETLKNNPHADTTAVEQRIVDALATTNNLESLASLDNLLMPITDTRPMFIRQAEHKANTAKDIFRRDLGALTAAIHEHNENNTQGSLKPGTIKSFIPKEDENDALSEILKLKERHIESNGVKHKVGEAIAEMLAKGLGARPDPMFISRFLTNYAHGSAAGTQAQFLVDELAKVNRGREDKQDISFTVQAMDRMRGLLGDHSREVGPDKSKLLRQNFIGAEGNAMMDYVQQAWANNSKSADPNNVLGRVRGLIDRRDVAAWIHMELASSHIAADYKRSQPRKTLLGEPVVHPSAFGGINSESFAAVNPFILEQLKPSKVKERRLKHALEKEKARDDKIKLSKFKAKKRDERRRQGVVAQRSREEAAAARLVDTSRAGVNVSDEDESVQQIAQNKDIHKDNLAGHGTTLEGKNFAKKTVQSRNEFEEADEPESKQTEDPSVRIDDDSGQVEPEIGDIADHGKQDPDRKRPKVPGTRQAGNLRNKKPKVPKQILPQEDKANDPRAPQKRNRKRGFGGRKLDAATNLANIRKWRTPYVKAGIISVHDGEPVRFRDKKLRKNTGARGWVKFLKVDIKNYKREIAEQEAEGRVVIKDEKEDAHRKRMNRVREVIQRAERHIAGDIAQLNRLSPAEQGLTDDEDPLPGETVAERDARRAERTSSSSTPPQSSSHMQGDDTMLQVPASRRRRRSPSIDDDELERGLGSDPDGSSNDESGSDNDVVMQNRPTAGGPDSNPTLPSPFATRAQLLQQQRARAEAEAQIERDRIAAENLQSQSGSPPKELKAQTLRKARTAALRAESDRILRDNQEAALHPIEEVDFRDPSSSPVVPTETSSLAAAAPIFVPFPTIPVWHTGNTPEPIPRSPNQPDSDDSFHTIHVPRGDTPPPNFVPRSRRPKKKLRKSTSAAPPLRSSRAQNNIIAALNAVRPPPPRRASTPDVATVSNLSTITGPGIRIGRTASRLPASIFRNHVTLFDLPNAIGNHDAWTPVTEEVIEQVLAINASGTPGPASSVIKPLAPAPTNPGDRSMALSTLGDQFRRIAENNLRQLPRMHKHLRTHPGDRPTRLLIRRTARDSRLLLQLTLQTVDRTKTLLKRATAIRRPIAPKIHNENQILKEEVAKTKRSIKKAINEGGAMPQDLVIPKKELSATVSLHGSQSSMSSAASRRLSSISPTISLPDSQSSRSSRGSRRRRNSQSAPAVDPASHHVTFNTQSPHQTDRQARIERRKKHKDQLVNSGKARQKRNRKRTIAALRKSHIREHSRASTAPINEPDISLPHTPSPGPRRARPSIAEIEDLTMDSAPPSKRRKTATQRRLATIHENPNFQQGIKREPHTQVEKRFLPVISTFGLPTEVGNSAADRAMITNIAKKIMAGKQAGFFTLDEFGEKREGPVRAIRLAKELTKIAVENAKWTVEMKADGSDEALRLRRRVLRDSSTLVRVANRLAQLGVDRTEDAFGHSREAVQANRDFTAVRVRVELARERIRNAIHGRRKQKTPVVRRVPPKSKKKTKRKPSKSKRKKKPVEPESESETPPPRSFRRRRRGMGLKDKPSRKRTPPPSDNDRGSGFAGIGALIHNLKRKTPNQGSTLNYATIAHKVKNALVHRLPGQHKVLNVFEHALGTPIRHGGFGGGFGLSEHSFHGPYNIHPVVRQFYSPKPQKLGSLEDTMVSRGGGFGAAAKEATTQNVATPMTKLRNLFQGSVAARSPFTKLIDRKLPSMGREHLDGIIHRVFSLARDPSAGVHSWPGGEPALRDALGTVDHATGGGITMGLVPHASDESKIISSSNPHLPNFMKRLHALRTMRLQNYMTFSHERHHLRGVASSPGILRKAESNVMLGAGFSSLWHSIKKSASSVVHKIGTLKPVQDAIQTGRRIGRNAVDVGRVFTHPSLDNLGRAARGITDSGKAALDFAQRTPGLKELTAAARVAVPELNVGIGALQTADDVTHGRFDKIGKNLAQTAVNKVLGKVI